VLPAFTVQSARVGVRGWNLGSVRQDITVGVNNIGNALYAEAANASFFRPEPRRNVVLGLSTAF
jgi:outer membrane receptor protein involved in Fe transport